MKIIKKSKVDSSQIESKYDKTRIAIQLVDEYDASLLKNISTIADLSSGAYGLYNSGENNHVIPENIKQQIRLVFQDENLEDSAMSRIPVKILSERFPDVDPNAIQIGDVIRVNVSRIINESPTDLAAVLEVAATIIHEATHEIEFEQQGWTSETGPEAAERKFYSWAMTNIERIRNIPELQEQGNESQQVAQGSQQQIAASKFKKIFRVKGY